MNNRRRTTLLLLAAACLLLAAAALAGASLPETAFAADFSRKNLPPCPAFPFGTDWMGRDMLKRTLAGLSLSIRVGALTACVCAVLALTLEVDVKFGKAAEEAWYAGDEDWDEEEDWAD